MRGFVLAFSFSLACLGRIVAAPELVPGTVTVTLRDSSGANDSVHVEALFNVIGDSTAPNAAQWTVMQLAIDGTIRLSGVIPIDSVLRTLPPNTLYLDSTSFFVTKAPHSISVLLDPAGVSGEAPANAINNLTVSTFNFHPKVLQDTVYTGTGCQMAQAKGK